MAKYTLENMDVLLKKLFPPEYMPKTMAGKIHAFLELSQAGLLPAPWYVRAWRRLKWYAYAPSRWIHRNCGP